jgi:hypothetical protein
MYLFQSTPIIVEMVDPPAQETTVVDVLLGAFGLTGVLMLSAVALGLLCGAVLILLRLRGGDRGLEGDSPVQRGLGIDPAARDAGHGR